MAYAGETVRIISRITGYDGGQITNLAGVVVTVNIKDPSGTTILNGAVMAWNSTGNAEGPYWYYDWATVGLAAGTYQTQVTASGGTPNLDAWEYGRVRLRPTR